MKGERKQVTVLFCDIVRSADLAAQLGPEEFHQVIDRFFRVALAEVHRYEGTVNQFLGDGLMALFGAPIAHEDHARRAVLAALDIAERAEVTVRIGINSGLVVVGTIGDDLRVDYTAFGDTTVLAARLQAAAPPAGGAGERADRRADTRLLPAGKGAAGPGEGAHRCPVAGDRAWKPHGTHHRRG
jgi:class 3 adenylate cyclase